MAAALRGRLSISSFAGIEMDRLSHSLAETTPGTFLDGAEIIVAEAGVRALCKRDGHRLDLGGPAIGCPKCSSRELQAIPGPRLCIDSIEVD